MRGSYGASDRPQEGNVMASRDVRCTPDCTCRGDRDGRHPFDTTCASSLDAVGTATRFIQGGLADVAVCGASEGANFEIDFRPALPRTKRASAW